MNTYLQNLTPAAEAEIWPLARKVTALLKQAAGIEKRAAGEVEMVLWLEGRISALKTDAAARLTESNAAYQRWKTEMREHTGRLQAAREASKMFVDELLPTARREISDARAALCAAASAFRRRALPACESKMTALLAAVAAEADDFEVAMMALGETYAVSFAGDAPEAAHPRLQTVKRWVSRPPVLIFAPQDPAERAAALAALAPPAANVAPAALAEHGQPTPLIGRSTPTPLDGLSDSPDAPQAVHVCAGGPPTPALDTLAAPESRFLLTGDATGLCDGTPLEAAPDFLSGKPAARDYAEAPDVAPDTGAGAALDAADDEAQDAALFDADAELDAPDLAAEAPAPPAADAPPAEKKI
jgi:hypothetical protein